MGLPTAFEALQGRKRIAQGKAKPQSLAAALG
jgi:hypothetical protein